MELISHEMKRRSLLSPSEQPYYLPLPPQNLNSGSFNLSNKVSPSILLIIIILAIIFFVSGLLHLLVRFLMRPPNREPEDSDNVTAVQGQLQQLFHLHDAGVDQSFIDTLPVFHYKAIIGVKNPFDCAVCLCEFELEDKLRLIPKCSHAFHMECIDTWLLSHSTCPLCRANLIPDFSPGNACSPVVLVLESGSESSREIVSEIVENNEVDDETVMDSGGKVVPVRLGKFRNVDGNGEGSDNGNVDDRRCFSMGSFEYVMDENSLLQVPIRTPMKKPSRKKKTRLPLTPGHRPAISEYDFESSRFEITSNGSDNNGERIDTSKKESFSVSKIWLRGRKAESSRRTFSFRLPEHRHVGGANGGEIGSGRWKDGVSELGLEEENQRTPSFARRTLLWLAGKQNKVVHSSFTPNV
ncbi:RING-H2 finger protein ATL13 [Hibiscus syriacus]|uniref:RING-type E3 ubiquitin transferase n=1 Tax=Hibiscus syriacus TaxID=106335 RepID=A0A6A3BP26_HIBSY|nr:RING-H2 finger protein ATL13-like [Hibiscus syriacus]KAE8718770.1 RING-H2 finger protein ATL13 [Hibiscus syriacus]